MFVVGILTQEFLDVSSVKDNQYHDGTNNRDTSSLLASLTSVSWTSLIVPTYPAPSTTGNTVVIVMLVDLSPLEVVSAEAGALITKDGMLEI